jgi:hypothetical protein
MNEEKLRAPVVDIKRERPTWELKTPCKKCGNKRGFIPSDPMGVYCDGCGFLSDERVTDDMRKTSEEFWERVPPKRTYEQGVKDGMAAERAATLNLLKKRYSEWKTATDNERWFRSMDDYRTNSLVTENIKDLWERIRSGDHVLDARGVRRHDPQNREAAVRKGVNDADG